MTDTATRPRKGDTTLRNIRVDNDLWTSAGEVCQRLTAAGNRTDRSKVARDAYEALIARETDPDWQALEELARERDTTPEALQALAVSQYIASIRRKRASRRS